MVSALISQAGGSSWAGVRCAMCLTGGIKLVLLYAITIRTIAFSEAFAGASAQRSVRRSDACPVPY